MIHYYCMSGILFSRQTEIMVNLWPPFLVSFEREKKELKYTQPGPPRRWGSCATPGWISGGSHFLSRSQRSTPIAARYPPKPFRFSANRNRVRKRQNAARSNNVNMGSTELWDDLNTDDMCIINYKRNECLTLSALINGRITNLFTSKMW